MFSKTSFPLLIVFFVIAILIFIFRKLFELHGFDWQVLSIANLFIYFITAISMNFLLRGIEAAETSRFLRNAYGGILIKLFACAGAAFIYILISGKNLNKPSLFAAMFLYLLYTFVELSVIIKYSNSKKNVKN